MLVGIRSQPHPKTISTSHYSYTNVDVREYVRMSVYGKDRNLEPILIHALDCCVRMGLQATITKRLKSFISLIAFRVFR